MSVFPLPRVAEPAGATKTAAESGSCAAGVIAFAQDGDARAGARVWVLSSELGFGGRRCPCRRDRMAKHALVCE